MFHLRNLLVSLDSRLKIFYGLNLLVMGLLFGVAAWGFRLFGPKFLRHIGLGGRQYANRTRRLLRKPCTVRLLGEPNLTPIQRDRLHLRHNIKASHLRSGPVSNLFSKTFWKDLHQNESRL